MVPLVAWAIEAVIGTAASVATEAAAESLFSRLRKRKTTFSHKDPVPTKSQTKPTNSSPQPLPNHSNPLRASQDHAHDKADQNARDYHNNYLLPHQNLIQRSPFLAMQYRNLTLHEQNSKVKLHHADEVAHISKAHNKKSSLQSGSHPIRASAASRYNNIRGKGTGVGSGFDVAKLLAIPMAGIALELLGEFEWGEVPFDKDQEKIIEEFKKLATNFKGDGSIFKKAFDPLMNYKE